MTKSFWDPSRTIYVKNDKNVLTVVVHGVGVKETGEHILTGTHLGEIAPSALASAL